MRKLFKRLFKRLFKKQYEVVIYSGGKPRKFKSFEKAIPFMRIG